MLPLLLVAMVSGANPEPVKLAATSFQFVNISPELAAFCSEHFAQQLTLEGIRVTTPNEISSMLGFERQKELMGCSEKATNCLAELANALGVDGLITGTVGKFGKSYQVNIKILSASDARPITAYSGRVRDEEELIEEYNRAAKKVAPVLVKKLGRAPLPTPSKELAMPPPPTLKKSTPQAQPSQPAPMEVAAAPSASDPVEEVTSTSPGSSGGMRRWWWVPAAGGAVAVGVGTGLMISARGKSNALTGGDGDGPNPPAADLTVEQAQAYRASGPVEQSIGVVAISVGVAAVAASAAMFLLGGEEGSGSGGSAAEVASVGVSVGPQGAMVGLVGVFP